MSTFKIGDTINIYRDKEFIGRGKATAFTTHFVRIKGMDFDELFPLEAVRMNLTLHERAH